MKRRYVAFLLALSMSLSATMVPLEPYYSTQITELEDVVADDISKLEENTELADVIEMEAASESTENTEIQNGIVKTEEISEVTEVQAESQGTESLLNNKDVLPISETANKNDEIENIPDKVLRSIIVQECDSNEDEVITKTEIQEMTEIWSIVDGISDLTGLEYAPNLTELVLIGTNAITDIGVLSKLEKLEVIRLENNQIRDISVLSNLKNLNTLRLKNNQIRDISILKELKNLTYIDLSNNPVDDISSIFSFKNLKYLYLDNHSIKDISMLENLKELIYISLANNQISDIEVLSKLEYLYGFDLSNNQISDISVLSKLGGLSELDLSDNQISDISVLSKLKYLEEVVLNNNKITEIPLFTSCFELQSLALRGNPLQNIENAKVLLDVQTPTEISISASSEYVTPEMQFDSFFDISERKMYVGNQMQLELEKRYLTEESVKITYTSKNTDILEINTEGVMFAKKAGTVNVTATCGSIQKTFQVKISEQEKTVEEYAPNLPSIITDKYGDDGASILDTKNLLWSINTYKTVEKAEIVSSNVKDYGMTNDIAYIAEAVYSKDRLSWWNNYIVHDKDNTLYRYTKSDENARYKKSIFAEDVTELYVGDWNEIYYLTENDELYHIDRDYSGNMTLKKVLLAQNVKNYQIKYSSGKVFTNNGDVIIFNIYNTDNSKVYSNLGTKCVFSKDDEGFLVLNGSTATYYNQNGEKQSQLENVVEIGVQNSERAPFIAVQDNGKISEYRNNTWNSYAEDFIQLPIKEENLWGLGSDHLIDANNVLWDLRRNKKIAENVTYLDHEGYIVDGVLYTFDRETPFLTDVKKYCQSYHETIIYYLATDGTVWELIDSEPKNQILNSVADIFIEDTRVYMIRQDGSVWKYNGYKDCTGIAYKVLDGNPIVMGDINGDSEVKINDMLTILHGISGSQTLSESQQLAADIDKDGKVTVRDMLRIMHYISGASSTL